MNFRQRSYQPELLDKENIPFEDIEKNMQELNFINTYLGGHKISIKGLKKIIGHNKQISICEIGCGGGDNLFALLKFCNKKNIKTQLTGIDINQACIRFAKKNEALKKKVTFIASDYKLLTFQEKPDIIFSSLFCHHFSEEEIIHQIKWMKNNCQLGFFINDLQRNFIAYFLIKTLTRIFSNSYLVKNDAPLSVAKSLTKKEWQNIFDKAKIKNYEIRWQWAFRYLITYKHAE